MCESFVKDGVVILNGTEDVKTMAQKMEERRKQAKLSKVNAEITTNTTCNHWIITGKIGQNPTLILLRKM